MDLEEHARRLYNNGTANEKIIEELNTITGDSAKSEAILNEIITTEHITPEFVRALASYQRSGVSADESGLGCRGAGDFLIHHKIAELIDNSSSVIDARQQDDAGVVQVGNNYLAVSVDGMHSRLSHFPFLAGYHVARAAIRDIIVMGCEPKALLSDIHLANDGDIAKVFDYTAGVAAVSELTDIPLISGSTLRIGGDLVLGDRITGAVGCVGMGNKLTPRREIQPGDILIMTEGSGGGTIATTALYNGFAEVVKETLNLNFITLGKKLLASRSLEHVHALTDVTNGGLRGDAFELATSARVRVILFETRFLELVNGPVLDMLQALEIDPMGISIDSLLLAVPEKAAEPILEFIRENGARADIVGCVQTSAPDDHDGAAVLLTAGEVCTTKDELGYLAVPDADLTTLTPEYREAPYTPIKKVVNIEPGNRDALETAIEDARRKSMEKKNRLKSWIRSEGRM